MKKLVLLPALFIVIASLISWSTIKQVKPRTNTANTTIAAIKLAEAKAILSKANTKNVISNLSTADGGI